MRLRWGRSRPSGSCTAPRDRSTSMRSARPDSPKDNRSAALLSFRPECRPHPPCGARCAPVSLRTKVKNALDEARILVLGTQVLLGFQYRAFFETTFPKLPGFQQSLNLIGLFLLLVVMCLVMLPAARHRLVECGQDTPELHLFTMNAVGWALVPFSVALALGVFSAAMTRGMRTGITLGIASFVVALAFWFGVGIVFRRREHRNEEESEMKLEDK